MASQSLLCRRWEKMLTVIRPSEIVPTNFETVTVADDMMAKSVQLRGRMVYVANGRWIVLMGIGRKRQNLARAGGGEMGNFAGAV